MTQHGGGRLYMAVFVSRKIQRENEEEKENRKKTGEIKEKRLKHDGD